ncbi:MAG: diphthine--ammonia ligase [Candidatus Bathyarchaeota archaeon]|nr:MAG: diphthine--ammonia ligase [Candidatus Bathyarchaeota archaeon]
MKVVVHWIGGKESCLAYHKVVAQGHEVAYLLSYVYKKPYIFHSFPVIEGQSKALGIPQLKVKMKKDEDILATLTRLNKKEGIESIVTGDIVGAHACMDAQVHQTFYEAMCRQAGMSLIMPIENPSKDTYDVLREEISAGIKPIINCVNLDCIGEEWLGRVLDDASIKDLKALADRQGIDVCGEDGKGYRTMVIDAPLFKNTIEIGRFKKKMIKEKSKSWKRTWLLMDIKKAFLRPKQ